jgi:hypothetical protein
MQKYHPLGAKRSRANRRGRNIPIPVRDGRYWSLSPVGGADTLVDYAAGHFRHNRRIRARVGSGVLHDLQLLELHVGHVPPDRRAVHHGRSDNCTVNCDFVLDGHLTSPIDQRIKLFSNHLSASFPVIKLSIEPKVVVESDTEVPDLGFPRDGSLEHDDFASRTVTTLSEKNRTAFVWTHVNSPEAKP